MPEQRVTRTKEYQYADEEGGLSGDQRQRLFDALMKDNDDDREKMRERSLENLMSAGSRFSAAAGSIGGRAAEPDLPAFVADTQEARRDTDDDSRRRQRIVELMLKQSKRTPIGETITEIKQLPEELEKPKDEKKPLSVMQAKKSGLARIGRESQDMYEAAVKKGIATGQYNPTSYFEVVDSNFDADPRLKSAAATEAHAAASSWIDSFLRDESGAAIPDNEREKYFKVYFPQPGDSEQTVQNKRRLREIKMRNAEEAGLVEDTTSTIDITEQAGYVTMQSPDGQVGRVRRDRVQKYLDQGAVIIE